MELAILAGLGALGWTFAAKGSSCSRPEDLDVPPLLQCEQTYPFDNQVDSTVLLRADARAARQHVDDVFDADTQTYRFNQDLPTVRSDRNSAVDTQRKLETFTGTDEDAWKRKVERPPAFRPEDTKGPITFRGTVMPTKDLYDPGGLVRRNVFGTRLHNMLPFEQQRVGPGLGVPPEVATTDGFHSRFRVLPCDSMNAHRINQLPGRVASGAAVVPHEQQRRHDVFEKRRPSLVDCPPAVTGGMAKVQAHAALPTPLLKATRSDDTLTCIAGMPFVNAGHAVAGEQRTKKKQLEAPDPTNRKGNADGQTARSRYSSVRTRRDSDMPENTGSARQGAQRHVALRSVRNRKTGELDYGTAMGAGATCVGARAGIADGCFVLKNTFRESSGDVTGMNAVVKSGAARHCEPGSSGLRETPAVNAGGYSVFRKDTVRSGMSMGDGRETDGRTEQGSMAVFDGSQGRVKHKRLDNAFACGPAAPGRVEFAQQRAGPGRVEVSRKVPSEDPRVKTLGLGVVPKCI